MPHRLRLPRCRLSGLPGAPVFRLPPENKKPPSLETMRGTGGYIALRSMAASLPPVTRLTFRYDRIEKYGMSTCGSSRPDAAAVYPPLLAAPRRKPRRPRLPPSRNVPTTPLSGSRKRNYTTFTFKSLEQECECVYKKRGSKRIQRNPPSRRGIHFIDISRRDRRRPFACLFANQREPNRDDQPT